MSYIVSEIYEALIEAGASEEKAKAAARSIPVGQYFASKEDLEKAFGGVKSEVAELRGEVKTEIAEFKVQMAHDFQALYRHLWLMGGGIVTLIVALLKLLP